MNFRCSWRCGHPSLTRIASWSHPGFDPQNCRVAKYVDGVHQYGLLYKDQLEPVAMLDVSNNVTATFAYATRSHVPDFMVTYNASGAVTGTYRYVVDHLGSVRMVVNTATGVIAQQINYDEFGKATLAPGSTWATQPFAYAGGIYDNETGLTRVGARDYDASTGRWTAKDPILWGGGQTNLYQYVGGDPVNSADPSGLSYYDFNICGGFGLGITFGAFYDPDSGEIHPYFGGGLVTPGVSASVSISQEDISAGVWSGQLGGELGPAFGAHGYGGGSWFGEVGAGWGLPAPVGVSLTGYYTW